MGFVGGKLFGCKRILFAVHGDGAQFDFVTCSEQLGNVALCIQNAFALHFGGMRSQDGRHKAACQCLRDGLGCDAGPAQAGYCNFDAALLGVSRALVDGATPDVVAIFCKVGQVTEIREGADDADGLVA